MTATKDAEAPTSVFSNAPRLIIDLQDARPPQDDQPPVPSPIPSLAELEHWATAALDAGLLARHRSLAKAAEVTVRIVGEAEGAELNRRYRGRNEPTNVLSFTFEAPPGFDIGDPLTDSSTAFLGDLVICAPVVRREAEEQDKAETAHWAHLIAHGVLHLLGYDHLSDADASVMEALEIRILGTLGFSSPYEVIDDVHDERRRI